MRGSDAGTYRHDLNLFHRDKLELCQQVKQSKQLREANAEYGFRHDDLDCVGVSRNTLDTFQEINHDGLTLTEVDFVFV